MTHVLARGKHGRRYEEICFLGRAMERWPSKIRRFCCFSVVLSSKLRRSAASKERSNLDQCGSWKGTARASLIRQSSCRHYNRDSESWWLPPSFCLPPSACTKREGICREASIYSCCRVQCVIRGQPLILRLWRPDLVLRLHLHSSHHFQTLGL